MLDFPIGMDITQVHSALKTIPNVVKYSEANSLVYQAAGANDPEYGTTQHSIHPFTIPYVDADINIEPAWDVISTAGVKTIRAGVFDSGLDWKHEDFGGPSSAATKVVDGWDFESPAKLKALSMPDDVGGHGTACAGIIGALRNNSTGVAGIAGGDGTGSTGVALYGMRIYGSSGGFTTAPGYTSVIQYYNDAIVMSAIDDPTKDYAFGLHISNHSYMANLSLLTPGDDQLFVDAVHFANRAKVTLCASRGNAGYDKLVYPAIMDDDWVFNIGGTGIDGKWLHSVPTGWYNSPANSVLSTSWNPSFGHDVDVAAPAELDLARTARGSGNYMNFSGTSSSAPHVAGVVGLLMSYLNEPTPDYKNLAPEDCEHIIQRTAVDDVTPHPGYDQYIGHGLLDAGAALESVEWPKNAVRHFGTNSLSTFTKSQTLVSTGLTINLTEAYSNDQNKFFQAGTYIVDKYKVDATVNHTLGITETITDYWARPSSSTVLEDLSGTDLLPRQRVAINSCGTTSCSMTGYVYKVYDGVSNFFQGWWPFDVTTNLADAKFEYTLLTNDPNGTVGVNDVSNQNNTFVIFPNPSSDENTITFSNYRNENIIVNLYDMQGKLIKEVFSGSLNNGSNYSIKNNISNLSNGIYFYKVTINEIDNYRKVIKK